MAQLRDSPYIWATWLARLLAGEAMCEWAGWFRAHHQGWTKPSSDFDSARWMLDHTALVNEARESREALGHEVLTENQNSLSLRGATATLAGKPDLIAVKGSDLVVVDAKTGRPSPHHAVQVIIYQYAVARLLEQYRRDGVPGSRDLSRLQRADPGQRGGREVHRHAGNADQEPVRPDPGEKGAARWGVPVVRHHRVGLPGTGVGGTDGTGKDHG